MADADAPRDYSTDKGPWTLAKLLERLSIKNENVGKSREVEEAEEGTGKPEGEPHKWASSSSNRTFCLP